MNCPQCGISNRENAKFCNRCGQTFAPSQSPIVEGVLPPPLGPDSSVKPSPPRQSAPGTIPLASAQGEGDAYGVGAKPLHDEHEGWMVGTQPLATPPPDFASLPEGELLHDRQYAVDKVLSEGKKLNVYSVYDPHHRLCTQCNATGSAVEGAFCEECGVSFDDMEVVHPSYLLRETLERELFSREAQLTKLKLRHPGMVTLYEAFEDRPYGKVRRYYLLSGFERGVALSRQPHPQPEENVLKWGQQLAETLAYLHRNRVQHRAIQVQNVLLLDSHAWLTNFGRAERLKQNDPSDWYAKDVQALVQLLRDLLDAQSLSPPVAAIFGEHAPQYRQAEKLAADCERVLNQLQRSSNITLITGRRTDVGRQRELNEDNFLVFETEQAGQEGNRSAGVYVVADGMGGHSAGEVASDLIVTTMRRVLGDKIVTTRSEGTVVDTKDYEVWLREACQQANRVVHEEGRQRRSDMGSTLVAALVVDGTVYHANVGDSRIYLINQEGIKALTTDHSLVESLIAAGQITEQEARSHPQRNVIYRTVGDKPQVEIDMGQYHLKRGDKLLLCSDGLHGMIDDDQIYQSVIRSQHPQQACNALIGLANDAGGDDNVTVLLIQVEEIE